MNKYICSIKIHDFCLKNNIFHFSYIKYDDEYKIDIMYEFDLYYKVIPDLYYDLTFVIFNKNFKYTTNKKLNRYIKYCRLIYE